MSKASCDAGVEPTARRLKDACPQEASARGLNLEMQGLLRLRPFWTYFAHVGAGSEIRVSMVKRTSGLRYFFLVGST